MPESSRFYRSYRDTPQPSWSKGGQNKIVLDRIKEDNSILIPEKSPFSKEKVKKNTIITR